MFNETGSLGGIAATLYLTSQGNSLSAAADDLDGDGDAEPVALVSNTTWHVWSANSGSGFGPGISSYEYSGSYDLGISGAPLLGDVDGDGKADPIVVNSAGWHVWKSADSYRMSGPYALGIYGTPLVEDFDGDGKADPAVYVHHISGMLWYKWLSSNNYQADSVLAFGEFGAQPVAGDIDGDGKADYATVDETGDWLVMLSSLHYAIAGYYALGVAGKPLLADFDADGKADPVMVSASGGWYVWPSASGYQGQVSLRNTGAGSITDWKVSFDLDAGISSLWDGILAGPVGSTYTVSPPNWKKEIQAGETAQFGFVAAPGGMLRGIANITFNGMAGSPAPEPPPVPTPPPGPVTPPAPTPAIDSRIICGYYPEWGIYQRNYQVADIPAEKLNVINYAFANVSEQGEVCVYDSWAAVEKAFPGDTWDQPLRGNYNQLIKLKALYPHLVTMISVGGWALSGRFSDAALTEASRNRFAISVVSFITRYGFDGVDIDWEYPVGGGLDSNKYRPEDKRNFSLLLQELRRQLDALGQQQGRTYYLSIAAPAGYQMIANIEPSAIAQTVNWINLMTYDFHGGWETVTGHLAPLWAPAGDLLNVHSAVQIYLDAGVPAQKIVVGVPFYGRSWRGVPPANNGLYQPAGGVPMGTWDDTGVFDYGDIAGRLTSQPGTYMRFRDDLAQVPYIYAASLSGGVFITYEDAISIQWKAAYVRERNLGGMMFWDLSGDARDELASLLSVIHRELSGD